MSTVKKNIIYFYLSTCLIFFVLNLDLTSKYFFDYDSYINYFTHEVFLEKVAFIFQEKVFFLKLLRLITEEYIWLIYTYVLGSLMSPEHCVMFTIVLIECLLLQSFSKFKDPIFLLFMWVVFPMGLATIGVMQIRQGLAFSVFMYIYANFNKPKCGAFLAAFIHTTFIIPWALMMLASICKKKWYFVFLVALLSIVLTIIFQKYFPILAGRRADVYKINSDHSNMNYLFSVLIITAPSFFALFKNKVFSAVLAAHVGLCIWTIVCFFLFKIGMSRVGYYVWLFLIPCISTWRKDKSIFFYYPILCFLLIYLILNAWQTNEYATLF